MAIPQRILGKTGLSVSVLGFGGSEVGYQEVAQKTVDAILGRALDAGVNLIDTAECYADSERLIGRALGKRRRDVVLMTKCGHAMIDSADRAGGFARNEWDPAMLSASIDRSLERLGTDHVDVIQFHSPERSVLDNDDAIAVLQKAREAGKARFIGCSLDGHDAAHAIDMGVFDTLQISVNVADQQAIDLVLPKAIERGAGVIVKRPIANAVWKNKRKPSDWYTRPYWDRLQKLDYDFLRGGVSDAVATALSFTLATPGVHSAIVGTTRPENVDRNAALVAREGIDQSSYDSIRERWHEVARKDWIGQR